MDRWAFWWSLVAIYIYIYKYNIKTWRTTNKTKSLPPKCSTTKELSRLMISRSFWNSCLISATVFRLFLNIVCMMRPARNVCSKFYLLKKSDQSRCCKFPNQIFLHAFCQFSAIFIPNVSYSYKSRWVCKINIAFWWQSNILLFLLVMQLWKRQLLIQANVVKKQILSEMATMLCTYLSCNMYVDFSFCCAASIQVAGVV